jgi:hypothetical protein
MTDIDILYKLSYDSDDFESWIVMYDLLLINNWAPINNIEYNHYIPFRSTLYDSPCSVSRNDGWSFIDYEHDSKSGAWNGPLYRSRSGHPYWRHYVTVLT